MSTLIIAASEDLRAMLREVVREETRAALAEGQPASTKHEGYMSVKKAAVFAEVHPDTIRTWVRAGKLSASRAGRELRIRCDELRRFLESNNAPKSRPTPEEEAAAILERRRLG